VSSEQAHEEGVYSFLPEDKFIVDSVVECVRNVLRRPDVTPLQVIQIGYFLVALGRLPRITKDFGMSVALKKQENEEISWHEAQLDADSFQLNSGGSVYDPQVGHDNYFNIDFEAGCGWRESSEMRVFGWLEAFREMADDVSWSISIDDQGDLPIITTERDDADDDVDHWALLEAQDPDDE
jgi:hypothetical protein